MTGSGTGDFSVNLTGLTAGATYYFRAYAINERGTMYSSRESFSTFSLPQIATVTIEYIRDHSVKVYSWILRGCLDFSEYK